MAIREKILGAISVNQPDWVPLPVVKINIVIKYDDVFSQFKDVVKGIGGKVELINGIQSVKERVKEDKATGNYVVNAMVALGEVDEYLPSLTAKQLEKTDTAYMQGSIAVAENGAVWIYEKQMVNRLLPFICQHLVLVVDKKDIVPTMHHAYERINAGMEGFGVFIAGPSKTADIEQSLVIGAHGPKNCTVFIVNS